MMATDLEDTDLLGRISGGDLVAIEAKYHLVCLTRYKNRHRSQLCKQKSSISHESEHLKARAFAELVYDIQDALEEVKASSN